MSVKQVCKQGQLKHLLTMEGLKRPTLEQVFATADELSSAFSSGQCPPLLSGRTIINLFFEPSTRTRNSFELAAKRLSADILNVDLASSSTSKGESLLDTLWTLQAMHCDMFIVRHPESGAAHFIARHVDQGVAVLNAGDGRHAHPTQALLDLYTIRHHKPDFGGLRVVVVGDILHSRVARSLIHGLNIMNVGDLRLVAPPTLLPEQVEDLGAEVYHDLDKGLADADVVYMLRLQKERMVGAHLPDRHEYYKHFGLTSARLKLAKADAIVMHPGPMNRGVEIESSVADGPQSVILEQVGNGVSVRMAVMANILSGTTS
ncbi:MAG: aspartate carbamoyltransferase [Lysobacteraceae bacterium]|nr:MAG: aspartate carbamoyltransferase [Xanthomonadaceae bacterium]